MPITNRTIEPVLVSQVKVPSEVFNEFDFVVNATLSNLIKQMANLSLKAADIFNELTLALGTFVARTEALEIKIQVIDQALEPSDQLSIIKPLIDQRVFIYKNDIDRDDELLIHTQMPDCIKEMFNEAKEPPELFKFDEFRKNNEKSMRFYTDPDFFLRDWLNNARNERNKKKERRKKRKTTVVRESLQPPPPPPPMFANTIVQEPILEINSMNYNYGDVAVYEDPTVFNFANNSNSFSNASDECNANTEEIAYLCPIPPPPPMLSNFPNSLPPAPPPIQSPFKLPVPTVKNLLADIQKGAVLKPVAQRLEFKEKTRDFRELIQELRPAWEHNSDESEDSDD